MLDGLRTYFYERRRGIATTAGVFGALYLTGQYVLDRLEDMREQVMQSQRDRENLRKRFETNQEDISFTIMTHMPSLSKSILDGMDVERVTQELQKRSKTARGRPAAAPTSDSEHTHSDASLTSSVELLQDGDARSDVGSIPASDASALDFHQTGVVEASGITIPFSASSSVAGQSWVQEFNAQQAGSSRDPSSSRLSISSRSQYTADSPRSSAAYLSDSFMSDSLASAAGSGIGPGSSLQAQTQLNSADVSVLSKSKLDLWKEVKMLAFTRTLTIIYSTVLLTLLTSIQLSIIGRMKYIQSVIQLCRDEKLREMSSDQLSLSSLLFHAFPLFGEDNSRRADEDGENFEQIDDKAEQKFLVLSWWLLYVGWKDVGERVRRSVEDVFESVSLKARLGPIELHRLIMDARRRVENEVTYEGSERRINFLSTVLPQSPETLSLVLAEGGIPGFATNTSYSRSSSTPSSRNPESDPVFAKLLAEVRGTITSPAFQQVLEASLDRATDVLFEGLRRNIYADEVGAGEIEKPRLASLLPGLARWGRLSLNSLPNEIVDNVLKLKETTALAALIYSNFDTHIR